MVKTGVINEKELSRQIKSGELKGVYYLYGSDSFGVGKYRELMKKALIKQGDEAYNLHEYQGKNIDVDEVAQACEGLPMFADCVCVTVCDLDLEAERLSADRLTLLLDTVNNLPDTTVLIFYTSSVDICDGKKYPTAKNKKLVDAVSKSGTVCVFPVKTASEISSAIKAACKELGCTVTDKAAVMLRERCLSDMNMIQCELEKLCSYTKGGLIDENAVAILTPETGDAKSYELADAAAVGNVGRAMELYHELIDSRSDPIYLLYVLTGSMNDLYRARLAVDSGKSTADVIKDFGYKKTVEFRIKNAFSSVRRISVHRLRRCMEILLKADTDIKSGAGVPDIIVESAIAQMLTQ